ncbi:MAG: ribosome biosis GTPase / thiamine phosphate phosphatase [Actinomycetota bacterium]|nr:ribosome biosis GTPase / thiamine phosphate phosphatase [Actinomycetota bacterium]
MNNDFPRSTHLDLPSLGWDDQLVSAFAAYDHDDQVPARVSRVDRGACDALAVDGPLRATFSGALLQAGATDPVAAPCVGDWVVIRQWCDGRVTAEAVLPRRTAFVRASVTPGTSHGQVLAANVDYAVVTEGLHPEPDLGRIERFLALAWESGSTPLVVLTKADLVPDAAHLRDDVAAAAPGVTVLAVSATTGEGLADLQPYVTAGRTLALLGPSGAGKSTLTNALAGDTVMVTRALRGDGKGRHTTVHRELVLLPGGGLILDTPGLRSVGLTDVSESLDLVFADIEQLAGQCRFADCEHRSEPDCAVLAALASGELPERRWESYVKLGREARWMAMRHDARLRAEERAKWKRIHKEVRSSGRTRP